VDVLSSVPGEDYSLFSGTSMASPHTAGSVALLLSIDPSLGIREAEALLEQTARHGDPGTEQGSRYGRGIIDVLAAATAATDDNVVEGTVTDGNGDPVGGATVTSSFGTEVQTADDGSFRLYLGDGEHDLSVTTFGFSESTTTVSVSGGEAATQDFTIENSVDIAPLSLQPEFIGQGDSFDIVLSVTNLETFTVSLSGGLSPGDLTLTLGDTEVAFDQTIELGGLSGQAALSVEVAGDASLADFSLDHTFGGPNGPIEVTTGPTTVVENSPTLEIVDWSSNTEVELGAPLELSATVENTGDGVAAGPVNWWLFSPQINSFTAGTVELEAGESTTVPFAINIPAPDAQFWIPGTTGNHGFITDDDTVGLEATFQGPIFGISSVDTPRLVDRGETLEVGVTVQNLDREGTIDGSDTLEYEFDGVTAGIQGVSAPVGGTDSVTFQFDTTRVVSGSYTHSVSSTYSNAGPLSITVGRPDSPVPLVGNSPPTDPDGDGLYEDLDGDGEVTLNDVQVFSQNLHSNAIQEFPEFYDFTGDGEVTIGDVHTLFEQI